VCYWQLLHYTFLERQMRFFKEHLGFLVKAEFLLIIGSLLALLWANELIPGLNFHSYEEVKSYVLWENPWLGHHHDVHDTHGVHSPDLKLLTVEFLVLEMLFPFFFAFAAIEIFEEIRPGGNLDSLKKAAVPILATIGGMLMPIVCYLVAAQWFGVYNDLSAGWLVCTATDIAFAAIAAVAVFGPKHPAKAFVMVIAVVDDGLGLVNIAVFLRNTALESQYLLLIAAACLISLTMTYRNICITKLWRGIPVGISAKTNDVAWYWYLPLMLCSWYGFYAAGLHPSLGLVPVIFCMPAPPAKVGAGVFSDDHHKRTDALGVFEHQLEYPVAITLGLFGFLAAGIPWTGLETASIVTLIGIIAGKVLGITLFGCIAARFCGLPDGLSMWHIPMIGLVCAIAFTVGMFVTILSPFESAMMQKGVMMGCVLSVALVALCPIIGRICRIKRLT